jgi:hypothetical protein
VSIPEDAPATMSRVDMVGEVKDGHPGKTVSLYPLGLRRRFGKIKFAFPRMAHRNRSAHIMEDTIDHATKCGTK